MNNFCQYLYEIENELPRTKYCTVPCMNQQRILNERFNTYIKEEIEKCKSNPYYFAVTYFTINEKKFTTRLSKENFNKLFNIK